MRTKSGTILVAVVATVSVAMVAGDAKMLGNPFAVSAKDGFASSTFPKSIARCGIWSSRADMRMMATVQGVCLNDSGVSQ